MSRFLKRNPFAGSVRLAKKKRKRQPKPHARRHLVQSLERRDHPGSMLEVSAIALLGRPDGESKDPIDQMLRTAEDMRTRREQYERLTNLKRSQAAEPLRHDGRNRRTRQGHRSFRTTIEIRISADVQPPIDGWIDPSRTRTSQLRIRCSVRSPIHS